MILTKKHEHMAKYCQDIYLDEHLTTYDHIDKKDTCVQVAFIIENNELIIVFRGSDSGTDWLHNFMVTKSEYPIDSGVYVHTGFLLKILSIKDTLKQKIKKYIEENSIKKVVFTGHSLGHSCILAAYVSFDIIGDIPIEIITFGGPYVGNDKFKEAIEERCECTRIVLDRDIVSRMPSIPGYGYVHCGKPIQIRDDQILERETGLFEHCHWLLLGCFKADFGVRDHMVWNYYAAIKKRVSGNDESKDEFDTDDIQVLEKIDELDELDEIEDVVDKESEENIEKNVVESKNVEIENVKGESENVN